MGKCNILLAKKPQNTTHCGLCNMTENERKSLLKRENFFKKTLAILACMCYYIQADFGCDEAGGGHSAEFSPAYMGNFR